MKDFCGKSFKSIFTVYFLFCSLLLSRFFYADLKVFFIIITFIETLLNYYTKVYINLNKELYG